MKKVKIYPYDKFQYDNILDKLKMENYPIITSIWEKNRGEGFIELMFNIKSDNDLIKLINLGGHLEQLNATDTWSLI